MRGGLEPLRAYIPVKKINEIIMYYRTKKILITIYTNRTMSLISKLYLIINKSFIVIVTPRQAFRNKNIIFIERVFVR